MSEYTRAEVEAILGENHFMTLATSDGERPWANAVEYIVDDHGRLYFVSKVTSRHGRNIGDRAPISVAIHDTTQPPLVGRGIQIDGEVERLEGTDNPFVSIANRTEYPADLSEISDDLAAYRVTPTHVYMPDLETLGFERIEIDMDH